MTTFAERRERTRAEFVALYGIDPWASDWEPAATVEDCRDNRDPVLVYATLDRPRTAEDES